MVRRPWLSVGRMFRLPPASRLGLGLFLIPVLTISVGIGTASASSIAVEPVSVTAGGEIELVGDDWVGLVTLTFVKGNTVLPAGTVLTKPNGGLITLSGKAPDEPGEWQVCAQGVSSTQQGEVSTCADLSVVAAPTASRPETTVAEPTLDETTTSIETSTSAVPVDLTPVTPPLGPDGVTDVEEESISKNGSGLTGLTVGVMVGIVALAGIGVAGLLKSGPEHRPRRREAIGLGIIGVLLAGATAIAMPPPKVNSPKLALSRVQASEVIPRNSSKTVSATCPAGSVIVGGGWSSNWSSSRVDDVAPLVAWLDSRPGYVRAATGTTNSLQTFKSIVDSGNPVAGVDLSLLADVKRDYWPFARADGTVHVSDTVWPSGNQNWKSLYDFNMWLIQQDIAIDEGDPIPPRPTLSDIEWSEDVRQAFVRLYYTTLDRAPSGAFADTRLVGTLVGESVPFEHGWRVSATLPPWSLQTSLTLSVVALCAPLAASADDPGVLGVTLRSGNGTGSMRASCESDERLSAIGFEGGQMRGLTRMVPNADLSGAEFTALGPPGTSLTAVCIRAGGLETTTAVATTNVSGSLDDGTAARCPTGFTVVGGGAQLSYKNLGSGLFASSTAVNTAAPVDSKSFRVVIRSPEINFAKNPSGPLLLDIPAVVGVFPYTAFANRDITEVVAHALCARRVFASRESG